MGPYRLINRRFIDFRAQTTIFRTLKNFSENRWFLGIQPRYGIIVIPLYSIDISLDRLHLCFSLITAIVSASLFIIDCAIFSIHLVESRDFMVTCLISMELTAAMVLFLTVLSLLVGGNWTSIYRKMDLDNDESRQTSLGDWVMRNNIQPSLQILGMILFQVKNGDPVSGW